MGAHLDHAGAVEHDDEIGHPDGAEAMRHEDRDAAVGRSAAPFDFPPRAAAAKRSKSACSVSASSAAVGSSSTRSSG